MLKVQQRTVTSTCMNNSKGRAADDSWPDFVFWVFAFCHSSACFVSTENALWREHTFLFSILFVFENIKVHDAPRCMFATHAKAKNSSESFERALWPGPLLYDVVERLKRGSCLGGPRRYRDGTFWRERPGCEGGWGGGGCYARKVFEKDLPRGESRLRDGIAGVRALALAWRGCRAENKKKKKKKRREFLSAELLIQIGF